MLPDPSSSLLFAARPVTGPRCLADYDAVLTEAGDYTAKYVKLRELFGSISGTWRTAAKHQLRPLPWSKSPFFTAPPPQATCVRERLKAGTGELGRLFACGRVLPMLPVCRCSLLRA